MHSYKKIAGIAVVAAVVLAAFSAVGFAAPSYFGPTGLILTPTADVLNQGEFNVGAHYVDIDDGDVQFFSGNYGLADKLEVGATIQRVKYEDSFEGSSTDTNTFFNAKYRLVKEEMNRPSISIGILDAFDKIDNTPYVVLSKSFSWDTDAVDAPRFHIGVGSGSLDGVFGGVSAALGARTMVMAEYDSDNFNFGAQFAISDNFRIRADLFDGDDFGFGISYNKLFY